MTDEQTHRRQTRAVQVVIVTLAGIGGIVALRWLDPMVPDSVIYVVGLLAFAAAHPSVASQIVDVLPFTKNRPEERP